MKVQTPVFPASPPRRVVDFSVPCALFAGVLFAATGCSDSHSDEFQDFSQLQSVEPNDVQTAAADAASLTAVPAETAPVDTTPESPQDPPAETVAAVPATAEIPPAPQPDAPQVADSGAAAATENSATPLPIKLLIPHRQFRTEDSGLRVSFDDIDLLKILNMDPVPTDAADHFPDWLRELSGKRVRVRGYMRPGFKEEDITEFLFVRDNGECCYGPIPKIYDMIAVTLADGQSTVLIEGTPFDVEGTLRIEPFADEVELYGLFFIDDGVIIE